ncbi:hypothetical protein Avbf_19020, partial [Armadillidium vulgare]
SRLFTMFKNYKKKCCIPLKQHKTILSSLGLITPFIEEKFNLSKNNIESYEGLKDQKDYSCDNLYYNQSLILMNLFFFDSQRNRSPFHEELRRDSVWMELSDCYGMLGTRIENLQRHRRTT